MDGCAAPIGGALVLAIASIAACIAQRGTAPIMEADARLAVTRTLSGAIFPQLPCRFAASQGTVFREHRHSRWWDVTV